MRGENSWSNDDGCGSRPTRSVRNGSLMINSGRTDVSYEDWYGQKLDRKLLDLLKKYS